MTRAVALIAVRLSNWRYILASAAVWATSPSGLVCHGMAGLPCDEQSLRGAAHLQLLTRVADSGAPIILRPDEAPTIVNDDRYAIESLLIACPIRRRGESVAVVEVFQRPGARLGTQRGYLRFVAQMCELASESRVLDAAYVLGEEGSAKDPRRLPARPFPHSALSIHPHLRRFSRAHSCAHP